MKTIYNDVLPFLTAEWQTTREITDRMFPDESSCYFNSRRNRVHEALTQMEANGTAVSMIANDGLRRNRVWRLNDGRDVPTKPDEILQAVTSEWQTTRAIMDAVYGGGQSKYRYDSVYRKLTTLVKHGMVEKSVDHSDLRNTCRWKIKEAEA